MVGASEPGDRHHDRTDKATVRAPPILTGSLNPLRIHNHLCTRQCHIWPLGDTFGTLAGDPEP